MNKGREPWMSAGVGFEPTILWVLRLHAPVSLVLALGQQAALSECSGHDPHKHDPKRPKLRCPEQGTDHTRELKPDPF